MTFAGGPVPDTATTTAPDSGVGRAPQPQVERARLDALLAAGTWLNRAQVPLLDDLPVYMRLRGGQARRDEGFFLLVAASVALEDPRDPFELPGRALKLRVVRDAQEQRPTVGASWNARAVRSTRTATRSRFGANTPRRHAAAAPAGSPSAPDSWTTARGSALSTRRTLSVARRTTARRAYSSSARALGAYMMIATPTRQMPAPQMS